MLEFVADCLSTLLDQERANKDDIDNQIHIFSEELDQMSDKLTVQVQIVKPVNLDLEAVVDAIRVQMLVPVAAT